MTDPITLYGYRYSVYCWIVRMVLAEKQLSAETVEIDPFDSTGSEALSDLHPFGRVPVLAQGAFRIYETGAICRYLDAAFSPRSLTPNSPQSEARMAQVIAIIDSYGYRPLVRQVFSHAVFRPAEGTPGQPEEIAAGLRAAAPVLASLEAIATEGRVLDGQTITLADCHLAPILAYFLQAPEAARIFASYPALAQWWAVLGNRPSLVQTDPGLPGQ